MQRESNGMKKKIHVLYTIPNFDTAGSGKALLNIAQRLNKNRFEVSIACFHTRGAFFENVKRSGIPVHVFPFTASMNNRLSALLRTWRISRKLRKIDADIVHSFHYSNDYTEALASRLAGKKWVFTKKNMSWGNRAWKLRSWLANGIIAQNTDMLKNFYPGWPKVKLIPRGVNIEEFHSISPLTSILEEYKISAGSRIIMCVANLAPVKGIEVLIDAFFTIAKDFPNTFLFIVGDDNSEYGQSLHRLAGENQYRTRIIFTGKKPNVKEFLSVAEIFVLPTLNKGRQEGSPVALLEAMAMGKYVLASDVAGIRDQLRNLRSHLFPAGNADVLAKALKDALLLTSNQRSETGKVLRHEVVEHYSIEKEVQAHEVFYESLYERRN
jgi:glycosyltransferase involved in cell wall biosynthesis